jgi:hypothetical protein
MQRNLLLLLGFSALVLHQLEAQTISNKELEKLKIKSDYLLMGGAVFAAAGVVFTGIGGHNLALGVEWEGNIGNPELVDYRPIGRKFIAAGVPLFAAGAVLMGYGIHLRKCYNDKKKGLAFNTGYLDDGRVGIAMGF